MSNDYLEITSTQLWDTRVASSELRHALSELTVNQQLALCLRYWDLKTIEDIATILELTWDEADRCINEAIIVLRNLLPADFKLKPQAKAAA